MVNEGSSSFKKTPSVELMMPAPIRTTSGVLVMVVPAMEDSPVTRSGARSGLKRDGSAGCQDDVRAAPGLIVGQLPAMAGASSIFSEQNIAGVEHEVFAVARLEIQS